MESAHRVAISSNNCLNALMELKITRERQREKKYDAELHRLLSDKIVCNINIIVAGMPLPMDGRGGGRKKK